MVMMAGYSEIDVNELTVIPCVFPSWTAVTTVTPADQARMAVRSASESRVITDKFSNNFYDNSEREERQVKNCFRYVYAILAYQNRLPKHASSYLIFIS